MANDVKNSVLQPAQNRNCYHTGCINLYAGKLFIDIIYATLPVLFALVNADSGGTHKKCSGLQRPNGCCKVGHDFSHTKKPCCKTEK